jgi:enamine deaminase RidA (YjgF/YER057c/UK114 family)
MIGKYSVFVPEVRGDFIEEWRQCLKQIIYYQDTNFRLIKLNIFTDQPDYDTYIKVRKVIDKSIHNAFGRKCPAFNITVHPPEKPWKIAVEAAYSVADSSNVTTKVWNSIPYVVCESDFGKEVWACGLGFGLFYSDTKNAASAAFDQMKAILDVEGMSYNHLVRQWNYIGNILEIKKGVQNYQVFNKVRSEVYQKYRTIQGYPAATGIGMRLDGFSLDFCAVIAKESVIIKPIDNPAQINPYEYGQDVLRVVAGKGKSVKSQPLFERALLISGKVRSTLFISGTASILGQDITGIEDIEKQTIVTLDNIDKLTDKKRIGDMPGKTERELGKFILLRVYVKNQGDFAKVKAICQERFPGVPSIFIQSDICRDNLLIEAEAEYLIIN